MKKRFGYFLSPAFIVLIAAFMLICCGVTAFGIFKLSGAFGFFSAVPALDITLIVLATLFFTLLVFILTASYVIDGGKVRLKLGFWDTTGGKFKIECIIKLVKATNSDKFYMNLYIGDIPHIALINIKPHEYAEFVNTLKAENPKILYEEAEII